VNLWHDTSSLGISAADEVRQVEERQNRERMPTPTVVAMLQQ
jgi:hypothetical protein